jgi:hypothetical protein
VVQGLAPMMFGDSGSGESDFDFMLHAMDETDPDWRQKFMTKVRPCPLSTRSWFRAQ